MSFDFKKPFGYPTKKPPEKEVKKDTIQKTRSDVVSSFNKRVKSEIKNIRTKWWDEGLKDFPPSMEESLIQFGHFFMREHELLNAALGKLSEEKPR